MRPIKKSKPNVHRFHEAANKSIPYILPPTTPFTFPTSSSELLKTSANSSTNQSMFKPGYQFSSVFNFDKIDSTVTQQIQSQSNSVTVSTMNSLANTPNSTSQQWQQTEGKNKDESGHYYGQSSCEETNFQHPTQQLPHSESMKENEVSLSKVFTSLFDRLVNKQEQKERARRKSLAETVIYAADKPNIRYILQPSRKDRKQKKKLPVPYRTEYTIHYIANRICMNSGTSLSTSQGYFQAGYIDPYSMKTISMFLQILKNNISGINAINLQSVSVYESQGMVQIQIACFVRQLTLANDLKYTYSSFSQGILKDFRVCNDYVQLRWDSDIMVHTHNLKEEIVIKKHNIWLSKCFTRNVRIIFRHMDLAESTKEDFLEFLQKQCFMLQLNLAKTIRYDSILNIGMIYL